MLILFLSWSVVFRVFFYLDAFQKMSFNLGQNWPLGQIFFIYFFFDETTTFFQSKTTFTRRGQRTKRRAPSSSWFAPFWVVEHRFPEPRHLVGRRVTVWFPFQMSTVHGKPDGTIHQAVKFVHPPSPDWDRRGSRGGRNWWKSNKHTVFFFFVSCGTDILGITFYGLCRFYGCAGQNHSGYWEVEPF